MNHLSHLVEELKVFWHGVEIPMLNSVSPSVMSCDLPAVRKVCGFTSFFCHSWVLKMLA